MKEIEFSTMFDTTASPGMGGAFFDAFSARHRLKVNARQIGWGEAWNKLVQFGLSSRGPDISEIGTTWLGSFETMEALRPFTPEEVASLGGNQCYPPGLWQACQMSQQQRMLAIPFTLDLRMVFYRRDWLQKAGVDEATAFVDAEHFHETLSRVKAAGHPAPLGITTAHAHTDIVHDMTSWIWSAGGEIRSADGKHMMLTLPQSRAGMEAYFGLNQFITPKMRGLTQQQVNKSFFEGQTAIAILKENNYLGYMGQGLKVSAEIAGNIGQAMLMRVPYLGGSALVIWRQSMDYQAALKLVQFLTSTEAWRVLSKEVYSYTPAHLDALAHSPLAGIPFYPAIQQSLKDGRSCYSGHRWSGVEIRLAETIEELWRDLYANPALNIAQEVESRFSALCARLEQTILASSW
jgi:ABC-type glycerol-3-phosphate transport system substrate-binding protein